MGVANGESNDDSEKQQRS